jgi:hypothetical protein
VPRLRWLQAQLTAAAVDAGGIDALCRRLGRLDAATDGVIPWPTFAQHVSSVGAYVDDDEIADARLVLDAGHDALLDLRQLRAFLRAGSQQLKAFARIRFKVSARAAQEARALARLQAVISTKVYLGEETKDASADAIAPSLMVGDGGVVAAEGEISGYKKVADENPLLRYFALPRVPEGSARRAGLASAGLSFAAFRRGANQIGLRPAPSPKQMRRLWDSFRLDTLGRLKWKTCV